MGNIFSQILGAVLVQKYGAKLIYLISTFSSAIIIALIPVAVDYGDKQNSIEHFIDST